MLVGIPHATKHKKRMTIIHKAETTNSPPWNTLSTSSSYKHVRVLRWSLFTSPLKVIKPDLKYELYVNLD